MKFFLLIFLCFSIEAQNKKIDPLIQQLERELLKTQNRFEQFFKDDFFKGFDQEFFGPNSQLFKQMDLIDGKWPHQMGALKTTWKESEHAKILVVEGNVSGEEPLDIEVNDGMISLKGTAKKEISMNGEKAIQRFNFHRSYSVPSGTDIANMKIEKKSDKELWLIFPYKTKSSNSLKKKKTIHRDDGLKPLKTNKSDPTI